VRALVGLRDLDAARTAHAELGAIAESAGTAR
jgi:hypothetical protein